MVKICQTGLLKLNFETRPEKRIFRFLPKISAGHGWSWNFFCQFPNPWALRVSGMGGYTSKCEKSQNHCNLVNILTVHHNRYLQSIKVAAAVVDISVQPVHIRRDPVKSGITSHLLLLSNFIIIIIFCYQKLWQGTVILLP